MRNDWAHFAVADLFPLVDTLGLKYQLMCVCVSASAQTRNAPKDSCERNGKTAKTFKMKLCMHVYV